ncbi:hypothetical protein DQ04_02321000, partial [Trypanosoma grayi]|uniref:hypothetical protein n=1 Tax=Trypanosoma grayi TaxID=71804 RepID=UPI0004F47998
MEGAAEKTSAETPAGRPNNVPGSSTSGNGNRGFVSVSTAGENTLRRVPGHIFRTADKDSLPPTVPAPRSPSQRELNKEEEEEGQGDAAPFVSTLNVYPRYRHHPSLSQSSFSLHNGSMRSATHSRMSSREQFSWDSMAWKEVSADLALAADPAKEYLRLGRVSKDSFVGTHDSLEQRPRKHMRSLAAWDKEEVEALDESVDKTTEAPGSHRGYITPIGMTDPNAESVFETAPLGHQHSFSLPSHKDPARVNGDSEGGDSVTHAEREGRESTAKGPIMTHVIVNFKHLYGIFYVPQSEWGTFNLGDLVSVESHTGENTGRVVCDLTEVMNDETLIPSNLAKLQREVLYPEDPSRPLEAVDHITNKETLLRLPRVMRRGMNKGKKRLYYARRRDTEAFNVCQRLIRERGFNLNVSSVEYQVDFKRITVFCTGLSSSVSSSELLSFIQQLAVHLRGSAVEVLFSAESPGCLEVTRGITEGAFNALYTDILPKIQEADGLQTRTPPPPPPPPPPVLHPPRVPRAYVEGVVNHMATQPMLP